MRGMSNKSINSRLDDIAHLRQSITDILTTPLGSRVLRRDYGFDYDLIDNPTNAEFFIDLFAEVARALGKWEPRLKLSGVYKSEDMINDGNVILDIEGEYLPSGEKIKIDGIIING